MIVLKHVEFEIKDNSELDGLLNHLHLTTSKIEGIEFKQIYFNNGKKEFVLFLDCKNEDKYHKWRTICPPPPGAKDWHETYLTREEYLK